MHGRSEYYQTCLNKGTTVTITATLPSGKSASKVFTVEPRLVIKDGDTEVENGKSYPNDGLIDLKSSVDVSWNDDFDCGPSWEQYGTPITKIARNFSGSTQCYQPGYISEPYFTVNPTTKGGQKITFSYYQIVN